MTASARDPATAYETAVSVSTISMLLAFKVASVDNGFGSLSGRNGLAQGFLATTVLAVRENHDCLAARLLLHEIG